MGKMFSSSKMPKMGKTFKIPKTTAHVQHVKSKIGKATKSK